MSKKKYYNISEVSEILDLPKHKLRYLDKSLGSKLTKVRGRRYYKLEDIEVIRDITDSNMALLPSLDLNTIDSILKSLNRMKFALEGA